jgi:hypothetical protein
MLLDGTMAMYPVVWRKYAKPARRADQSELWKTIGDASAAMTAPPVPTFSSMRFTGRVLRWF